MCQGATVPGRRKRCAALASVVFLLAAAASAQTSTTVPGTQLEWRGIGNSGIELSLASPASGPVARVWFSPDGSRLFVQTPSGRVFATADFQNWQVETAVPRAPVPVAAPAPLPSGSLGVRGTANGPSRLYAFGEQVLRSDDGGASWADMTGFEGRSIIGGGMTDLAVSPQDPEAIAVANAFGVWRSADGGMSWTGLNDALPNLPARRLTALPLGAGGVRAATDALGAIEWPPGEQQAWQVVPDAAAAQERELRRSASASLGVEIGATGAAGETVYAGSVDGQIWTSLDQGRNWTASPRLSEAPVEGFYVDPGDPRFVLAALGGAKGFHVLRTIDGGQFWEDLSADLPDAPAYGVTADRSSSALYAATSRGVFLADAGWNATGPVSGWTALSGLPDAPVLDVKLDAGGNRLFVLLEGYGVYTATAPHRAGSPKIVSSADLGQRPAAPGSLLTVLGGRVSAARWGDLRVPVLAASNAQSQLQVPFQVNGSSLSLTLDTGQGTVRFIVPIEAVSPALVVEKDGTPLVLNADTGMLHDTMNPVRSNGRLQLLATGLGAVTPAWAAGVAAPAVNPPSVVAPVYAYLDGRALGAVRATLAPGYAGLDMVEVQLPALADVGPAELYIEAGTRQSNHIRIWIVP